MSVNKNNEEIIELLETSGKAIEKAKELMDKGYYNLRPEIFSELEESDDDKIRKALLEMAHDTPINLIWSDYGIRKKDAIAWLEKQGKQNPTELPKGEDYGIDSLWHAHRILEKTLGKVEGYQTDDGILAHECAINAIKELYEQKPTWSEEDERMIESIISHLERQKHYQTNTTNIEQCQNWLKSLKNTVQPQPKQEWSEKDKKLLNDAISLADECDDIELRDWLKSLKPQS